MGTNRTSNPNTPSNDSQVMGVAAERPPALVTRILDRAAITRLMSPSDYLEACREAFLAEAQGRLEIPPPWHLRSNQGGFHGKGALLRHRDGRTYCCLKLNANFPGNPALGLPTIQGAVLLCDAQDGRLLAIMDSIEITLRRTAAATALAVQLLAPQGPKRLLLIGCGAQAPAQIEALAALGALDAAVVCDLKAGAAERLAAHFCHRLNIRAAALSELNAHCRDATVIVTCTASKTAFLYPEHVSPGTLICAIGADAVHKSEIAPALMAQAHVVVDSLSQCAAFGDLHHAIAAGVMGEADVAANLASLVNGKGRTGLPSGGTVVFDSTGVASQDAATAIAILSAAERAGAGLSLALGDARPPSI